MSGAVARMALACQQCGERCSDDAVLEAWLLHMQVEHDTDEVKLDLVAVCRCGATMVWDELGSRGGKNVYYDCRACGGRGSVRQG